MRPVSEFGTFFVFLRFVCRCAAYFLFRGKNAEEKEIEEKIKKFVSGPIFDAQRTGIDEIL